MIDPLDYSGDESTILEVQYNDSFAGNDSHMLASFILKYV